MDNKSVDSIAEVTLVFIKKDQEYDYEILNNFVWESDLEDLTHKIKSNVQSKYNHKFNKFELMNSNGYIVKALDDAIGIRFKIIGSTNSLFESSGLHHYINDAGEWEIFNDYLSKFIEVAKNNLIREEVFGIDYYKLLTLWNLEVFNDYWTQDYDEQLNFLGVLDWSSLNPISKEQEKGLMEMKNNEVEFEFIKR